MDSEVMSAHDYVAVHAFGKPWPLLFPPDRVLSPLFWYNVDCVPLASHAQGPTGGIGHHVGSGRRSRNSPCKLGSMSSQVPCSTLLFNVASADFARRPPDAPHFAVTQSASSPLEVRTEANLARGRHGRHDCCWSGPHKCLTSCGSVLFLIFFSEVCSFSSTSNVLRLQCVPMYSLPMCIYAESMENIEASSCIPISKISKWLVTFYIKVLQRERSISYFIFVGLGAI